MLSTSQAIGVPWRLLALLSLLLHGVHAHTAWAQSAVIDIGATTGRPGQAVDVTVSLATSGGAMIAATINDLTFYKRQLNLEPGDCRVNPTTGKTLTVATVHETHSARTLRLFVQSIFSPPPIHDGPLYTCTVHIAPTALPGRYPLILRLSQGFGPTGVEVPRVTGTGGAVNVTIVLVPSATPSPSATLSPSGTPTRSPTPTPSATATSDPCPPDLLLEPAAGAPGSQVMFSGRCNLIRAGRRGAVYFDDTHVAVVTGDAVGNYSGVVTIPSDAALGTHQIRVVNPRQIAAAPFEVTSPPGACAGDCDGDGVVTTQDLLQVLAIVFGDAPPTSCLSVDTNADGTATIDELLQAVQHALDGCSPPSG